MSFDVIRARAETPGCRQVIHWNNAGASLMPDPVLQAVTDHLRLEARIGGYEAAEEARASLERFYDAAAELIGCERDEIAFAENATRAWDLAFYSIPFQAGDRILTSMNEYASNFTAYLQVAKKTGAIVEVIPADEKGQIDIDALESAIDERVKLISLTHVPTNGGLVNPAAETGRIARENGILFLLDACQSTGQMTIDVNEIGCYLMCATGRKFLRGPRGTGFLYARRDVLQSLEPPFLDLHAAQWVDRNEYRVREDARRFECWESNVAGKIGLAAAIDYALEWGMSSIQERVGTLAACLRERLADIPNVTVRDEGVQKCGIVTFTIDGMTPEEIKDRLRSHNINVSVSPPEYSLLDMSARKLYEGLVRASVHYFNTDKEIETVCERVRSFG